MVRGIAELIGPPGGRGLPFALALAQADQHKHAERWQEHGSLIAIPWSRLVLGRERQGLGSRNPVHRFQDRGQVERFAQIPLSPDLSGPTVCTSGC
jgi:hypothetical protein